MSKAIERVRMTHPKLPGREIWVRPGGVAARERAGWLAGKPPAPNRSTSSAAAAAVSKKES